MMAQVTLYLDDDTQTKMRRAAEDEGLSQSQWVARLIRGQLATEWPQAVKELAGSWSELPEVEALREGLGADLPRESF